MMTPDLRRLALTVHVMVSVGFAGAVACFFALAIAGMLSADSQLGRAAYLAMEFATWAVILPLSFASLLTGLVSALGTNWGLFRHYWVLVKFLITVPSTLILLVHLRPIGDMARVAAQGIVSNEHYSAQLQLVAASGAALVVLLGATVLSTYKPRGMTRYGWSTLREQ
jgi:ABC-type anion transport system duplicated permease subunit